LPLIALYWMTCTCQNLKKPALDFDLCNSFETKLISDNSTHRNIRNDWCEVFIDKKSILLHSVISKSVNKYVTKKNILWLHGVGGTATFSFVLSGVMNRLADTYNVYAVDLPGFGRSTLPAGSRSLSGERL
jgi:pimeloyl-ACP methyl ester carboxylesterase